MENHRIIYNAGINNQWHVEQKAFGAYHSLHLSSPGVIKRSIREEPSSVLARQKHDCRRHQPEERQRH